MSSDELVDKIVPGMPLEAALEAFVAACNQPDTLAFTEPLRSSHLAKIRAEFGDPIILDESEALRSLAFEEMPLDMLFDWLSKRPMPLRDYFAAKYREACQPVRERPKSIFPWENVEASRNDPKRQKYAAENYEKPAADSQLCPTCNQPVTWIWFASPDWTWQKLCGRAGWLAMCDACQQQVAFKLVLMN